MLRSSLLVGSSTELLGTEALSSLMSGSALGGGAESSGVERGFGAGLEVLGGLGGFVWGVWGGAAGLELLGGLVGVSTGGPGKVLGRSSLLLLARTTWVAN